MAKKTKTATKGRKSETSEAKKTEVQEAAASPELDEIVDVVSAPAPEPEPEVVAAPASKPKPAPKPAPAVSQAPALQKIRLQDAAKRYVKGYKDHWFSGIAKYAKAQGFVDPGTHDECKSILKGWGATLK